jgi:hypothetical protein
MSRYDDQAFYRMELARRRNAMKAGEVTGQAAQAVAGGAVAAPQVSMNPDLSFAQRAGGTQAARPAPAAAPAAQSAPSAQPQQGPPNPMDRATMQQAAQRLMADRRATMEGFRTLGPIFGQTPEQATQRAALTRQRGQLDTDLGAISGQLNPSPQPVSPERAMIARQHMLQQIAQAEAQGYGNQPSARDQQPTTGDDYRRAQMAQRMGVGGEEFNRLNTLATPVTPQVVAQAEQTLGRPVGNFQGIQVAAQQQPSTATMGPDVPLQVRLANSFAANDAANAQRTPAPMQDNTPAARDAMERYMVQENARKLAEQQGRDFAAATGEAAIASTQAQTNLARASSSPEYADALVRAKLAEANAAGIGAETNLINAQTGLAQAKMGASEVGNRMANRDEQADAIVEAVVPGLMTVLGSKGVEAADSPAIAGISNGIQQLIDRSQMWDDAKASRYRQIIRQQLGVSQPSDLDFTSWRNEVDRVLSYLPTASAARQRTVQNYATTQAALAQLRAFLFPTNG